MDLKTIFRIAIKLIGVYFLMGSTVPTILYAAVQFEYYGAASLVGVLYWIVMPLFLIFKTELVMQAFELLKNFETPASWSFSDQVLMKSVLILIGGLSIVNALPELITQLLYVMKVIAADSGGVTDLFSDSPVASRYSLIRHAIGLTLGIIILSNYDRLANWFLPKPSEPNHNS